MYMFYFLVLRIQKGNESCCVWNVVFWMYMVQILDSLRLTKSFKNLNFLRVEICR